MFEEEERKREKDEYRNAAFNAWLQLSAKGLKDSWSSFVDKLNLSDNESTKKITCTKKEREKAKEDLKKIVEMMKTYQKRT